MGGVYIVGTSTLAATGNQVLGNSIGTDSTGKKALGNGTSGDGVLLQDASGNTVGGTTSGAGNLISGNAAAGISITTAGVSDPSNDVIEGNRIGTDTTGTAALGNAIGVAITAGSNNTIGGTGSGAQNVISGNSDVGVSLVGTSSVSTADNLVEGNLVGTDSTGAVALGNLGGGIAIMDSSGNTVGGTATGAGNVISGNTGVGILVASDGDGPASSNLVVGNFIGTDATGKLALGNTSDGVQVTDASNNMVGGSVITARNVISANGGNGVLVQNSASSNVIAGNYIGADVTGDIGVDTNGKSLGNSKDGVKLQGASSTTVGGTATGSGNVLSNNGLSGVELVADSSADHNVIEGNLIGTDSTGATALGNTMTGINIANTFSNTIGGTTAAARNVISGNHREGIFIGFAGSMTTPAADVVMGNYIGTDVTGMKALGNGLSGVSLQDSVGITIGGTTFGAGNLISGNGLGTEPGIAIAGTSQDNVVQGNLIGTDLTGRAPIGGSSSLSNNLGIVLNDAGNETIGGTGTTAPNTIAFNAVTGIYVIPATIPYNGTQIVGNLINSNAGDGIKLQTPAGQVVATLIEMNDITDNTLNGVWVDGPSSSSITQNTISGNMNDGVKVTQGTGNSILTNSIFNNTNLSIELTSNGNNSQPSPVLMSASVSGGNTTIVGTLQAAANTHYHLQFFASPTSTPPGFDEAETFLGDLANVQTDSSGLANFSVTVPVAIAPNQYLTSTATNQATNDTSQVSKTSPNLVVTLTAQPEPVNQTQNLTYTINLANPGASPTPGVTLADTLPSGVTFISATGGATPVGNVVTFPAVNLNRGDSMVYTIVVRADTAGTISNTATATYTNESQNPDIDPTKLTQTVRSTVNPVANLAVTATASPASVSVLHEPGLHRHGRQQWPVTRVRCDLDQYPPRGSDLRFGNRRRDARGERSDVQPRHPRTERVGNRHNRRPAHRDRHARQHRHGGQQRPPASTPRTTRPQSAPALV